MRRVPLGACDGRIAMVHNATGKKGEFGVRRGNLISEWHRCLVVDIL